jgi:copper(I)-binding protein
MTREIDLDERFVGLPVPVRASALILILTLMLTGVAACGGSAEDGGRSEEAAEPASSVAAPGSESEPGLAAVTVGDLEVHRPRVSVTPGGATAAAYLTLVDTGGEGDRLVAVRTAAAESASLHESIDDDGVHRMVARPEGFEVPAGGALELAPGGKHVMLMGLAEDVPGEDGEIVLTLELERAGAVEVRVPTGAAGGMDGEGGGHESMHHEGMDHSDH